MYIIHVSVYKYTCAYMYISLCMSVFMCLYMYLIMFLYICMHMCTYIVLCTYLSICMQMSVCTNKHMHVYTWVCICVHAYVHLCVSICVCIVCIFVHTRVCLCASVCEGQSWLYTCELFIPIVKSEIWKHFQVPECPETTPQPDFSERQFPYFLLVCIYDFTVIFSMFLKDWYSYSFKK